MPVCEWAYTDEQFFAMSKIEKAELLKSYRFREELINKLKLMEGQEHHKFGL